MTQAFRVLLYKHGADGAGYPVSNQMSERDAQRFIREWRSTPARAQDILAVVPCKGRILFTYGD